MSFFKNIIPLKKNWGLSVKSVNVLFCIITFLIIGFLTTQSKTILSYSEKIYNFEMKSQDCDIAIKQLQDGSDYLTSQMQQFVFSGDTQYMTNYWTEVNVTKSRENAVEFLITQELTDTELEKVLFSKAKSDKLIENETWAMRLVCESAGMAENEMPSDISLYKLNKQESELSEQDKYTLALSYIFGAEYINSKEEIKNGINDFQSELLTRYSNKLLKTMEAAKTNVQQTKGIIIVLITTMILITCVYCKFIAYPLIKYSKELANMGADTHYPLEEQGVNELKQFVRKYNSLRKKMEEHTFYLKQQVYIDFLTQIPNRLGIIQYVDSLSDNAKAGLGVLMIDIDDFKKHNDAYGHLTGDRTLKKVANCIASIEFGEDGICGRLSGEEFVLILKNCTSEKLTVAAEEILHSVRCITGDDVGLEDAKDYCVTVSIGGTRINKKINITFTEFLDKADQALYKSKHAGKNQYTEMVL